MANINFLIEDEKKQKWLNVAKQEERTLTGLIKIAVAKYLETQQQEYRTSTQDDGNPNTLMQKSSC